MSYPPNIAQTRNARADVAGRLAGEAQNRLRHAATILRTAPSGFPIGDPEAERVAAELSATADSLDTLLHRTTNLRLEV